MRIALSGTYSTGKTVTTLAIAYLTGIEKTHARAMRELMPVVFPGKRLEACTHEELLELIMRRFMERSEAEAEQGNSFISDGCPLQEWAYCKARIKLGLNPNNGLIGRWVDQIKYREKWKAYKTILDGIEPAMLHYTQHSYDLLIHLPIEFPIDRDGHRPIKEAFRQLAEDFMLEAYKGFEIPVLTLRGTIRERLEQYVEAYSATCVMDIDEAIKRALDETNNKINAIKLETN